MNKEKNEDNCIGHYCGVSVCLPEEDYKYYKGTLHEQIDELYLENKQLQERIDKAIEYIEENIEKEEIKFVGGYTDTRTIFKGKVVRILEILKGE